MNSIVTVTFSPCIDKSTSVTSLVPEKKLRCSSPTLEPGGGGINVARAIHKLGGQAIAVYPAGGYTGKHFNYLLHQENIATRIIESVNETRENIIVFDDAANKQYRFGMPGTELLQSEWQGCLDAVENIEDASFIVASGSLPPGVPMDIYARLSKIAKRKNAKLIVDTSGEALKESLDDGLFMIKPNIGELSSLTGRERIEKHEIEKVAREIITKYGCENVLVSMGAEGAVLITAKEIFQAIPPELERKSTVGAGDSMVAGMVLSLSKGLSMQQALQYAVATGTAATLNHGTELCNKRDTDMLYDLIRKHNYQRQ